MTETGDLTRDIRTASALVRDGDWRGLVWHFEGHDWAPLRVLAEATQAALHSLPVSQIGPAQIAGLAHPQARECVTNWLAIFGCAP